MWEPFTWRTILLNPLGWCRPGTNFMCMLASPHHSYKWFLQWFEFSTWFVYEKLGTCVWCPWYPSNQRVEFLQQYGIMFQNDIQCDLTCLSKLLPSYCNNRCIASFSSCIIIIHPRCTLDYLQGNILCYQEFWMQLWTVQWAKRRTSMQWM